MAVQESSTRGGIGSAIDTFLKIMLSLLGIVVLMGIGYVYWPQIKAAYYTAPAAEQGTAPAPTADTSALDAMKAQIKRMEAQLAAAQQPPVIVQSVPDGQAPQSVTITAPTPATDTMGAPVEQPAAPIVIVHQVSADGAHQTVTGSGACKVSRVAARCSK